MKQDKCLITESLFGSEVSEELYKLYADKNIQFVPCEESDAPYVIGNAVSASNCRLLSMTLPVYKTLNADSNGDFVFTILVYGLGLAELKKEAKRTYAVKINSKQYSIDENASDIRKLIKVDISSYNISIAEDESIGFFAPTDTICPAIVQSLNGHSNKALYFVKENAPQLIGCFVKAGGESLAYSSNTLVVDLLFERAYDSEAQYLDQKNKTEYNTIVEALKEKYEGKYVSVIGDSISTFAGVSDDGTANVTIAENEPYYPSVSVYDESLTYWGKLIKDVGMKTCIINSWSGSSAYGRGFGKNMLIRCADLHRDGGTPDDSSDDVLPDVIFVYMSANDLNGGSPLDDELLDIIANGSKKSDTDAWFAKVLDVAEKVGGAEKGKTYANFAQVYALSMNLIKRKYPSAEIYCLTFQESNHPNTKNRLEWFEGFNKTITALAEYFGASVVDLSKDAITFENCHAYAGDMFSLHPNAAGHEIMAENIAKAMYKNLK